MKKILIVEDDPTNLKLIVEILNSLDFIIRTSKDGPEALAMTDNDLYDMILMDIGLPGIDGIETARRIRKKTGYENTPIIALTAFAMKGDREKFLNEGFDEYISKPIHVIDFIALITGILKKRGNESR